MLERNPASFKYTNDIAYQPSYASSSDFEPPLVYQRLLTMRLQTLDNSTWTSDKSLSKPDWAQEMKGVGLGHILLYQMVQQSANFMPSSIERRVIEPPPIIQICLNDVSPENEWYSVVET